MAGIVVLGEQSRFVIEVGDEALNVFNILQIVNTARSAGADRRPAGLRAAGRRGGAGMMEGSAPNAVAAGKSVTVTGPFAPGNTMVQFAYSVPLGRRSLTIRRRRCRCR